MKKLNLKNAFGKISGQNAKLGILIAAGVFAIILIALPGTQTKKESKKQSDSVAELKYDYEQAMEKRLESIISQIDGAGKVTVMVKTRGGEENEYALNSNISSDADGDKKSESKYVIVNSGDGEQGVLIRRDFPDVEGVMIVCQGGNDNRVKNEIINAVSAVLGISKACVSVSKMK